MSKMIKITTDSVVEDGERDEVRFPEFQKSSVSERIESGESGRNIFFTE